MPITVTQQHPLYQLWAPIWRRLGDVYEGAGGFLDGSYLVPHPRELIYPTSKDATTGLVTVNTNGTPTETLRFRRRKELARYENFAAIVLDTLIDYLSSKQPTRAIEAEGEGQEHPLRAWWQDVDGARTHIDDWVKTQQLLAAVYGHVFVAMDRPVQATPPGTRAEQASPILAVYLPLDTPDWIASGKALTHVLFIEAVERESLDASPKPVGAALSQAGAATGDGARASVQYRLWTPTAWTAYDEGGRVVQTGAHEMGVTPIVPFYGRRRATIRVVGRSVLGDPKLYIDHYNLLSEKRSIERDQTFSILNIPLKDEQAVEDAQALAGNVIGTSNVLFSRLPAAFIEPSEGPVDHYETALAALERKIFRLIGLPWDSDAKGVETAESRKLKAKDLNRLLAGMADEAERMEYRLAELWFRATEGPARGEAAYEAAGVTISYPNDFQEAELLDVIAEIQAKLSLALGKTATTRLKEQAVDALLPDLDETTRQTITAELAQQAETVEQAAATFQTALLKAQARPTPTQPEDGEDDTEDDDAQA